MVLLWEDLATYKVAPSRDLLFNIIAACGLAGSQEALTVAKAIGQVHGSGGGIVNLYYFEQAMPKYDVVLVTALINTLTKCGTPEEALVWWNNISKIADEKAVVSILTACAAAGSQKALDIGQQVHLITKSSKLPPNIFIYTNLLNLYTKCKRAELALDIWMDMKTKQIQPTVVTLTCILGACAELKTPVALQMLHQLQLEAQVLNNIKCLNALMNAYNKCGYPQTTLLLWQQRKIQPSLRTYTCLLSACAAIGTSDALRVGEAVHKAADSWTDDTDAVFWNSMLHMYTRCGHPGKALKLWEDTLSQTNTTKSTYMYVVNACAELGTPESMAEAECIYDWLQKEGTKLEAIDVNSFINMYTQCKAPKEALDFWNAHMDSIVPTKETYTCVLAACAALGTPSVYDIGEYIHTCVVNMDEDTDIMLENSLLYMRIKCGKPQHALHLWKERNLNGLMYNDATLSHLFTACANTAFVIPEVAQLGCQIQDRLNQGGLVDIRLLTALLNMYAKCAEVDKAEVLFADIRTAGLELDLICWTVMISLYGKNRLGTKSVEVFKEMVKSGVPPDSTAFVSLLNSCAHNALIDEARYFYNVMEHEFSIFWFGWMQI